MRELSAKAATQLSDATQRALFTTRGAGAAVALLDGDEIFTCATSGESGPPAGVRSKLSGFTGLAIQKRQTLVCDDTEADGRVDAAACKALNVRSMAVTPIRVNGDIEGVFAIFFNSPRAVSRMHVAMLRTLADIAAAALEREPARRPSWLAAQPMSTAPVEPPALEAPSTATDLPCILREITFDEIAEAVDQIRNEPAPASPSTLKPASREATTEHVPNKTGSPLSPVLATATVADERQARPKPVPTAAPESQAKPVSAPRVPLSATVGAQQPVSPVRKRQEPEVLLAAADPFWKPFPERNHPVAPTPVKDPAPARIKAEPAPSSNVVPQPLVFQGLGTQSLRSHLSQSVFLRVAGIAVLFVAIAAGFVLYRSAGVRAMSTPVSTVVSSTAPPAPQTAPAPTPPQAAPTTPEETVRGTEVPAALQVSRAPERSSATPTEAHTKRAEESASPKPAIVVRSSIREKGASIETSVVEPPTMNFEPANHLPALPAAASRAPVAPAAVFEPAKVLYRTRPVYPPFARVRQLQGTVVVQVKISRDGKVVQATRISGEPILSQAATDAVKTWRFQPAKRNGIPVESDTDVAVHFSLGG